MIQLPKNQFGAMAALHAITAHLDKQIEKAAPKYVPIHHEILIETTRYGEAGEPLTLKLLCCIKSDPVKGWTAYPEGEVTETNGDFHEGETVPLSLEEMEKVVVEGEADYLRD